MQPPDSRTAVHARPTLPVPTVRPMTMALVLVFEGFGCDAFLGFFVGALEVVGKVVFADPPHAAVILPPFPL
ncbi:hypothetical protein ABIE18_004379 [Arthrobacter sp. 2762]